jgi:hypothetical protein
LNGLDDVRRAGQPDHNERNDHNQRSSRSLPPVTVIAPPAAVEPVGAQPLAVKPIPVTPPNVRPAQPFLLDRSTQEAEQRARREQAQFNTSSGASKTKQPKASAPAISRRKSSRRPIKPPKRSNALSNTCNVRPVNSSNSRRVNNKLNSNQQHRRRPSSSVRHLNNRSHRHKISRGRQTPNGIRSAGQTPPTQAAIRSQLASSIATANPSLFLSKLTHTLVCYYFNSCWHPYYMGYRLILIRKSDLPKDAMNSCRSGNTCSKAMHLTRVYFTFHS